MTSGTDELRRLLDERGVEWTYEDGTVSFNDGKRWFHAWAYNDGAMCVSMGYLTPAQAIAAALGTGTCHMELPDLRGPAFTDVYVCSECGCEVMVGTVMGESDVPKWCPWCGRKVVDA